jgi:hypothetical protein
MADKIETPRELLTPESQAFVTHSINEAIKSVFAQLAPVLESVALTPEKILEMEKLRRAPTAEQIAAKLRDERERRQWSENDKESRRQFAERQRLCPHRDAKQNWSISLIHNYPDHQTRGICMVCQKIIQPTHWEILAPDAENPRGKPALVAADSLYSVVQQIESMA